LGNDRSGNFGCGIYTQRTKRKIPNHLVVLFVENKLTIVLKKLVNSQNSLCYYTGYYITFWDAWCKWQANIVFLLYRKFSLHVRIAIVSKLELYFLLYYYILPCWILLHILTMSFSCIDFQRGAVYLLRKTLHHLG